MGLTKDLGALPRVITVANTNFVGINNTNPIYNLDVNGGTSSSFIRVSRDTGYAMLGAGLGFSAVYSRNNLDAPRNFIIEAANVGIGNENPASKLDVVNNATYQLRLSSSTTNYSNGGLYLGAIGTSDPFYYGFMRWDQSDQTLKIGSQHGNAVGGMLFLTNQFNNSPVERMRITPGGNVLIGTTTDNGNKLQVNGNISATSLKLSGNYNATVTTDGNWSSYQTMIPTGILTNNATYLISVRWDFGSGSNQPYYCYCSFLFQGAFTNSGGGTDNEFTPMCSTHTGGMGSTISFRAVAGIATTAGIQARLNNFSTRGGTLTIKAILLD
jgi:hypothetical protein